MNCCLADSNSLRSALLAQCTRRKEYYQIVQIIHHIPEEAQKSTGCRTGCGSHPAATVWPLTISLETCFRLAAAAQERAGGPSAFSGGVQAELRRCEAAKALHADICHKQGGARVHSDVQTIPIYIVHGQHELTTGRWFT